MIDFLALTLSLEIWKSVRNGISISFQRGRLRSVRKASKGGFIGREGVGWAVGFRAFGNGWLRWRLRVGHVSLKSSIGFGTHTACCPFMFLRRIMLVSIIGLILQCN